MVALGAIASVWMIGDPGSLVTVGTASCIGFISMFIMVAVAAIVFPITRKEVFDIAPDFVKKKVASIPVVSIVGVISLIFNLWTASLIFQYPSVSGYSPTAFYVITAITIVALVYFFVVRAIQSRRGIDIDLAYKTLPPE
jgi:hypothetical protein